MDRYDPYTDKFLRDTQYNILGTNLAEVGTDCISRQAAIDVIDNFNVFESRDDQIALEIKIDNLPSAQSEIIYCKDCKYWNSGSCEYPEHIVNSQDYMIGDIETDAKHFCGYAERKVTE